MGTEAFILLTHRPVERLLYGAHSPHDHLCPNIFACSAVNGFHLKSPYILEWKRLEIRYNIYLDDFNYR
jgi:hypothetical protein